MGLIRLEQLLRHAISRHTYHNMLYVKQISSCADDDDLSTLEGVDRLANEYCLEGTRYPNDPLTRRLNVGQFLLQTHFELDREIAAAEAGDADMLSRYLLPLPRMPGDFARRIAKARKRQVEEGRRERKARVEPLADNLPEARFVAGSRVVELLHDHRCCAAAMAEAGRLDTTGPVELTFSYAAPIYDEDGRRVPGLQRRHWVLRNTNRIHEMLLEASGASEDRRNVAGGSGHSPVYDTEWWLFYDRSDGVDGAVARDPWLAGAVDSLTLYAGRGLPPEHVRRQLAFAKANGLSPDLASRLPTSLSWYSTAGQRSRSRRVVNELGLRPWPLAELTHGMLLARAGTMTMRAQHDADREVARDPLDLADRGGSAPAREGRPQPEPHQFVVVHQRQRVEQRPRHRGPPSRRPRPSRQDRCGAIRRENAADLALGEPQASDEAGEQVRRDRLRRSMHLLRHANPPCHIINL